MQSDAIGSRITPERQACVRVVFIIASAWSLPLFALISRSDALLGIFFSPHGGLAFLLYLLGNVCAAVAIVWHIIVAPSSHRGRLALYLLAVVAAYLALAYPHALLLRTYLSPPFSGGIAMFYGLLMLPFSWFFGWP